MANEVTVAAVWDAKCREYVGLITVMELAQVPPRAVVAEAAPHRPARMRVGARSPCGMRGRPDTWRSDAWRTARNVARNGARNVARNVARHVQHATLQHATRDIRRGVRTRQCVCLLLCG